MCTRMVKLTTCATASSAPNTAAEWINPLSSNQARPRNLKLIYGSRATYSGTDTAFAWKFPAAISRALTATRTAASPSAPTLSCFPPVRPSSMTGSTRRIWCCRSFRAEADRLESADNDQPLPGQNTVACRIGHMFDGAKLPVAGRGHSQGGGEHRPNQPSGLGYDERHLGRYGCPGQGVAERHPGRSTATGSMGGCVLFPLAWAACERWTLQHLRDPAAEPRRDAQPRQPSVGPNGRDASLGRVGVRVLSRRCYLRSV